MTKNDLIDAVSVSSGLPKTQAGKAVGAIINALTDALSRGESVALTGFGTFSVRDRAERSVRNPHSGNQIAVAARRVPSFKPGKVLREKVSN